MSVLTQGMKKPQIGLLKQQSFVISQHIPLTNTKKVSMFFLKSSGEGEKNTKALKGVSK